jgi:hypothetical protein
MTPFVVKMPDELIEGLRLKSTETGHTIAYHLRQAAQQYLSGSNLTAGLTLSGGGLCSGSVLMFQVGR